MIRKNPYKKKAAVSSEIDLRLELTRILKTEKKGTHVVYRRARRENGSPVLCECRKTGLSGEPSALSCRVCDGMGYLYDDYPMIGYLDISSGLGEEDNGEIKLQGKEREKKDILYLEYDCLLPYTKKTTDVPDVFDRIWLPKKDINGKLVTPLSFDLKYVITGVDCFRLDFNGRIEYHKIYLTSQYRDNITL